MYKSNHLCSVTYFIHSTLVISVLKQRNLEKVSKFQFLGMERCNIDWLMCI